MKDNADVESESNLVVAENANSDIVDQESILKQSEFYVKNLILLSFGSSLCDTIIKIAIPVYYSQDLGASSSTIGISLSLIAATYAISTVSIPYLATSKYCWYDTMSVIRLFASVIVLLFMANVTSIVPFALCIVLNAASNIGPETTMSCITLILPENRADTYITLSFISGGVTLIVGVTILSILSIFMTFQQIFYFCAAIYVLLFVTSLFTILGKESKLLEKQATQFDELFYVEKKKRILANISNKYRRFSSLSVSIEEFIKVNQLRRYSLVSMAASSYRSKAEQQKKRRVDFPLYEKKATKIIANSEVNIANERNINVKNKSDIILAKTDWTLIYLDILLTMFKKAYLATFSNWLLLYLITKYNKSISLASLVVLFAGIAVVIGMAMSQKVLSIVKTILYGTQHNCNKAENIVLNLVLLLFHVFAIACLGLWFVFPYFHMGWFSIGFPALIYGLGATVPVTVITRLKTEHMEQKLLGIIRACGAIGSCASLFIIGLLWSITKEFVLYSMMFCVAAMVVITIIMLIVTKSITRHDDNQQSSY